MILYFEYVLFHKKMIVFQQEDATDEIQQISQSFVVEMTQLTKKKKSAMIR